MATRTTIGTFTVSEPRNVTQHYECAAWYKTIRVEPGTYEVVAYMDWDCGRKVVGHTLYVLVSGKVVDASFVSRIGASYGDASQGKELIGTDDTGTIHLNPYWSGTDGHSGLTLDTNVVNVETWQSDDGDTRQSVRAKQ